MKKLLLFLLIPFGVTAQTWVIVTDNNGSVTGNTR